MEDQLNEGPQDYTVITAEGKDLSIFFEELRQAASPVADFQVEKAAARCLRDMAMLRTDTEDGCGDYVIEYYDQWAAMPAVNPPLSCAT